MNRAFRLAALALATLVLATPPAHATWSIILIDRSTGEIGIGSATCLTSLDLRKLLPVMVVSRGAGVAQSQIDNGAKNRKKIFDQLKLGTAPAQIIELALEGDLFKNTRQYGVADFTLDAAGFTGNSAFGFKQDVHGTVGDLVYAIQGNILTGAPVIDAAVQAVTLTQGSLADRLMAGMEAARAMGGDGRCSCDETPATACGSPPVAGFDKSAHIGFVMVSRAGDTDGVCNALVGCASGNYWLNLNVAGAQEADPDPVYLLQAAYEEFKLSKQGRPDGLRSLALFDHADVLGDGSSTRQLGIALADLDGKPIPHGGATFSVTHAPDSAGLSQLGAVVDHGNGTYTLQFIAGAGLGTDRLAVRADDGSHHATLFPYPELHHRPSLELGGGATGVPASGGSLGFELLGPTDTAGQWAFLLLSAAGTRPGLPLPGGGTLPLNDDRLIALSLRFGATGVLAGSPGLLDAGSRAHVQLNAVPGTLAPLVGLTLWAAWATLAPQEHASNPVAFDILP